MPRLIIGHVTSESARIWVRGRQGRHIAFLKVTHKNNAIASIVKPLEKRKDYTAALDIEGLKPGRQYACRVAFGSRRDAPAADREEPPDYQGRFKTFPRTNTKPLDFLVGSCNLPPNRKNSDVSFGALERIRREMKPAFMIHCGDQIYYPQNQPPELSRYRQLYKDTWGERSPKARHFLTRLPHYMILDDHELTNNYHADMTPKLGTLAEVTERGLKAYREYQHKHNPRTFGKKVLHYTFDYGKIRFFALDVRTERHPKSSPKRMIGETQMTRFLAWLEAHKNDVKFAITPVPFVAEFGQAPRRKDKWAGPAFKEQRRQILDHLISKGIRKLVFLTGDMHNSYHAQMLLSRGSYSLVLHELMSSPLNQERTSPRGRYETGRAIQIPGGLKCVTSIPKPGGKEQFLTGRSNVMRIRVEGSRVQFGIHPLTAVGTAPAVKGSFLLD